MAHYHLLTTWRIQAPLNAVYAAIHNTPGWTDWWPGVLKVEKRVAGARRRGQHVCYEWHVHSTRWWMNLLAPFARSLFIRNHGHLMQQGAEGLARMLGAPLPSQENIDLKAGIARA